MLGLVWALREFRPYLYGQRLLGRTDHSCLRWLKNFKEPEGQVARWLESLAEMDFKTQLRSVRETDEEQYVRSSCNAVGLRGCGTDSQGSTAGSSIRGSPMRTADLLQKQKPMLLARDEWGRTLMVPHVHAVCGEKKAVKKQPRTDAANDCRLSAAA
ncbi:Retrovirus-related Pol polyprotein from transposon, partial [Trichinella britovi]